VNRVVSTYISTLVGFLSKLAQLVHGFAQDKFGDLCLFRFQKPSTRKPQRRSDQALVAMLSVFQSIPMYIQ
jgi:hypothetical protein